MEETSSVGGVRISDFVAIRTIIANNLGYIEMYMVNTLGDS